MIQAALNNPDSKAATEAGIKAVFKAAGYEQMADQQITLAAAGNAEAIGRIKTFAEGVSANIADGLPGLEALQAAYTNKLTAYAAAVGENIDTLSGGQDQLAAGVATVAGAVLGNDTLKEGVRSNFGNDAIKLLSAYNNAK